MGKLHNLVKKWADADGIVCEPSTVERVNLLGKHGFVQVSLFLPSDMSAISDEQFELLARNRYENAKKTLMAGDENPDT